MLKVKSPLFISLILFLVVNTIYFLNSFLGPWFTPFALVLVLVYIYLLFALLRQIVLAVKERFKDRIRLYIIMAMAILLTLIFLKPFGMINFYELESKDKLTAFQEGTANCGTTLHLKEDNRFIFRSFCFGPDEVSGKYNYKSDTIKFDYSTVSERYAQFKFGVIQQSGKSIYLYRSANDPQPYPLNIIKGKIK